MNGRIFFIIVVAAFGFASLWQIVANPTLGTCDCEETREWDASAQEESCECGYSLQEACDFAKGINSDCGLGLTPDQIQTLKAQAYAAAIRWKNNKRKGVIGVTFSSADFQGNFASSIAQAREQHQRLTDEGLIKDADLAQLLDIAAEQAESLPFGRVDDSIDLDAINQTIEKFQAIGPAQTNDSVVQVINAYCLELESYVSFAHGVNGFVEGEPGRIIGHLTQPNGRFKTDIIVSNSSSEIRNYTLRAFNAQGEILEEVHGEVGVRRSMTLQPAEMFSAENVSHFEIMEGEGVEFTAKYQSKIQGGSVLIKESPKPSNRWRLFPGEWDMVWDGVAIVNMGYDSAAITIRHFDAENELIKMIELDSLNDLAPMGKGLIVLSDLGFDQVPGSQFQIYATQPITLTALRGTLNSDQSFMWENLAIDD